MDDTSAILANAARLIALKQAALLDTPPEEAFDRLTRLAARILASRSRSSPSLAGMKPKRMDEVKNLTA